MDKYRGFQYREVTWGIELYLPKCTKVFDSVQEMRDYIDKRLPKEIENV